MEEYPNLQVICPNNNNGCTWNGLFSDLKEHVKACERKILETVLNKTKLLEARLSDKDKEIAFLKNDFSVKIQKMCREKRIEKNENLDKIVMEIANLRDDKMKKDEEIEQLMERVETLEHEVKEVKERKGKEKKEKKGKKIKTTDTLLVSDSTATSSTKESQDTSLESEEKITSLDSDSTAISSAKESEDPSLESKEKITPLVSDSPAISSAKESQDTSLESDEKISPLASDSAVRSSAKESEDIFLESEEKITPLASDSAATSTAKESEDSSLASEEKITPLASDSADTSSAKEREDIFLESEEKISPLASDNIATSSSKEGQVTPPTNPRMRHETVIGIENEVITSAINTEFPPITSGSKTLPRSFLRTKSCSLKDKARLAGWEFPLSPAEKQTINSSSALLSSETRVFLEISIGEENVGRVIIVLSCDKAPITCEKFINLCSIWKVYQGTKFDFVSNVECRAGQSIGPNSPGVYTRVEECLEEHDKPGVVTMWHGSAEETTSFFSIFLEPCPRYNGKSIVIGHVTPESINIVEKICQVPRNCQKPIYDIEIVDCGILS